MNGAPGDDRGSGLAAIAGLLADGTRATFCLALLDGRAWTAKELARHAGVAASTATEHLNLLAAGGLLSDVRQGRHRYVRLSGAGTAELIERLASSAPDVHAPVRSLSAVVRRRTMAYARTCYDHLAGTVGVSITEGMTARGYLSWDRGLSVTDDGDAWLASLGLTQGWPPDSRRPPVRSCLDWTERRSHLAGAVAAALCRHAFDAGWITRIGTGRAVSLTDAGRDALRRHLDVPDDVLRPPPR